MKAEQKEKLTDRMAPGPGVTVTDGTVTFLNREDPAISRNAAPEPFPPVLSPPEPESEGPVFPDSAVITGCYGEWYTLRGSDGSLKNMAGPVSSVTLIVGIICALLLLTTVS